MVHNFKQRIGSRAQVMHGTAKITGGGLTKRQLKYNKQGKIVSIKASRTAKKNNRLVNAGYITKKGVFGIINKKGGMYKPGITNVLRSTPVLNSMLRSENLGKLRRTNKKTLEIIKNRHISKKKIENGKRNKILLNIKKLNYSNRKYNDDDYDDYDKYLNFFIKITKMLGELDYYKEYSGKPKWKTIINDLKESKLFQTIAKNYYKINNGKDIESSLGIGDFYYNKYLKNKGKKIEYTENQFINNEYSRDRAYNEHDSEYNDDQYKVSIYKNEIYFKINIKINDDIINLNIIINFEDYNPTYNNMFNNNHTAGIRIKIYIDETDKDKFTLIGDSEWKASLDDISYHSF